MSVLTIKQLDELRKSHNTEIISGMRPAVTIGDMLDTIEGYTKQLEEAKLKIRNLEIIKERRGF